MDAVINRPIEPYGRSSVESILDIGESGTAGRGASGQGLRDRPGDPSGDRSVNDRDVWSGDIVGPSNGGSSEEGGEFGGVWPATSGSTVFSLYSHPLSNDGTLCAFEKGLFRSEISLRGRIGSPLEATLLLSI